MNKDTITWSPTIISLVNSYQDKLLADHGESTLNKFKRLFDQNPEAAISEAVVFGWLLQFNFHPELNETLHSGGPDFICSINNSQFLVEVTCLGVDALTNQTGLGFTPGQPSFYSSSTKMMRQRVSNKARQFAEAPMPRIVIITTLHQLGGILLGTDEALSFFISDWGWTIPIGEKGETYRSTELKESIFFRMSDDRTKMEPTRQSISAILLMPIFGDSVNVIGILHPDPTFHLDPELFPKVPFLQIKDWSPTTDVLYPEWTINEPIPPNFKMQNIE